MNDKTLHSFLHNIELLINIIIISIKITLEL